LDVSGGFEWPTKQFSLPGAPATTLLTFCGFSNESRRSRDALSLVENLLFLPVCGNAFEPQVDDVGDAPSILDDDDIILLYSPTFGDFARVVNVVLDIVLLIVFVLGASGGRGDVINGLAEFSYRLFTKPILPLLGVCFSEFFCGSPPLLFKAVLLFAKLGIKVFAFTDWLRGAVALADLAFLKLFWRGTEPVNFIPFILFCRLFDRLFVKAFGFLVIEELKFGLLTDAALPFPSLAFGECDRNLVRSESFFTVFENILCLSISSRAKRSAGVVFRILSTISFASCEIADAKTTLFFLIFWQTS
jgi:hypothetical protein